MENYLLISDAAKEVRVESHVLRYWEEELHLPIKRNELGHRYYTREDVERFKQIKSMKERGLQLKAIKMILKDGKIDVMLPEQPVDLTRREVSEAYRADGYEVNSGMAIDVLDSHELEAERLKHPKRETEVIQETKEEKARRLQWLLQQLIRETLQENNKELCRDIKESVIKELDYQFRVQEEREEERTRLQFQRNEEYYQRMDELLRRKTRLGRVRAEKQQKIKKEKPKRKKVLKEEKTKEDSVVKEDILVNEAVEQVEQEQEINLQELNVQSADTNKKRKRHSIF